MNKEALERAHAEEMNRQAVEKIKQEVLTKEEAERIEGVVFEDDERIKLRDGREYIVPPCNLKDARRLMKLVKTVNIDAIILNFVPTEDEGYDKQREDDLFDILLMAFKLYPHVDKDYLDEYCDLNTARKIIEVLIGLNGLKK